MPGFNGTGPAGMGPMTGWGMGQCGTGQRRTLGRGSGRGMGFGRGIGFGRGFGRGFGISRGFGYTPADMVSREDELDYLRRRSEALESDLAETRKVMERMEKEAEE